MEERDVGATSSRAEQVELGVEASGDPTPLTKRRPQDASRLHADTLTSRGSMPSSSRLLLAARHRNLPLRGRVDLLRAHLARRVRRARAYAVRVGPATVFLSEDDYEIDWASFAFVAVDDAYAGDYRDAFVVDVGAHKGYYGAYALSHGARRVVSYEPESTNASYLLAASARLDDPSRWEVRRAAVGAAPGEAPLHVMGASWGHAIHPPDAWAEHEVGVEEVRVEALADVLSHAAERARGARTVVKVNIEGEECPTILGTPPSVWRHVAEIYVETHPWAACGSDQLARHLAGAGLAQVPSSHAAVLRLARR
jgi:FkbM family methyltransferase